MSKPNYEVREATETLGAAILRTDCDGTVWVIPMDEANSDYQAYLDKDKPQTPLVIDGD